LIDDSPTDVLLTRRALASVGIPHELQVANDGEEGLNFLLSSDSDRSEQPDLILLDLNMPKKDGFEVLRELRAQPAISNIPVIILTSSTNRRDVERCYTLHANSYMAKPFEYGELRILMVAVSEYWFGHSMIPG
jgi:CheY-like chemotaxis protein